MNSRLARVSALCSIFTLVAISFLLGHELRRSQADVHVVDIRQDSIDWHYARGVSSGWHLAYGRAVKLGARDEVLDELAEGAAVAREVSGEHFQRVRSELRGDAGGGER